MQTGTHWKQLIILAITRPYILANPRWDPTRCKPARPKCVPTLIEPRLMVPPPYLSTTKVVSSWVGFVNWHVAVEHTTRIWQHSAARQVQTCTALDPQWTGNRFHAYDMRTKPTQSPCLRKRWSTKDSRAVSCQWLFAVYFFGLRRLGTI